MKKNIFKKLGGVLIGLALGLGVAVGVTAGNKVSEVKAADTTKTLTFDTSENPGGWPTANSTTLTNYTYTLDDVDYTFALKNVKCNSGYLMLTKPAALGLPAIQGYKLTKVVAKNSGGCSTAVEVGVSSSSSSADYISGGAIQTWSTTSSTYTYNLSETSDNTVYYLYVTNKNAQITELSLTYEGQAEDVDLTDISLQSTAEVILGESVDLIPVKTPSNANKKTTFTWESLSPTVASVTDGKVKGLAVGTAQIRLNATDIGKSVICTVTVNPIPPVPVTHTIAGCYSVSTGTSVKFNGVYMGTYGNNPYQGIFFADGEYGILIYKTNSVPESWEVGKTVVAVSGKTAFYNGLVQVTDASFETTSATVADPVPYTFLGTETTGDALSRKSSISGTVTSVTGQTDNAFVTGTDGKVTVDLGDDKTAMIFIKKGVHTAEELAEYSEKFTVGAYVVVTGFLNYYNNATTFKGIYIPGSFQITVPTIVSTEVYDADAFALDFLNDTDAICSIVKDDHGTELVAAWSDIGAKFTALSDTEKAKVSAADSKEDSDLGRAVERYDYLVGKYGLTNFLSRSVLSSAGYNAYNQNSSNTSTTIIFVVSVASLTTLAALMVIKRRKAIEK